MGDMATMIRGLRTGFSQKFMYSRGAASKAGGFAGLSFPQKLVYSSAVINVTVIGFVWLRRQFKMAHQELKEHEELRVLKGEMDEGEFGESNRFRCFFAAQRYNMMNTTGPEEETSQEVQVLLKVLAQCREDLYEKISSNTLASLPINT